MKYSVDRILTTHAGALPQPDDLKQMHSAKISGRPVDEAEFGKRVRESVAEVVKKQLACGVDIVNDGEVGKSNFSRYARERLSGFIEREAKPEDHVSSIFARDMVEFGETSSAFFATARSSTSVMLRSKPRSKTSKPACKDRDTNRLFSPPSRRAPSSTG